ncbi:NAD(P)/FAD-dependent oxidoreductase [Streptomyces canus]|uniref:NAD(P)/FAD-dependent oxidoreductase n=1 Tax=Streptomyces canus TaxID=58343 RepID=UPI002E36526A|nr:FAD-dependent oxidoreductase [Streptomyces canus]
MHNPSSRRVAVVGAGHAGANVAALLRQRGHTGEIVLLGAEKELPYQRPPLSKDYLKTALPATELLIKPEEFWNEQGIDARLGVVVEEIRPDDDEVVLEGGERIGYDTLVLATGAEPRKLDVPGAALGGVHTLRTRRDADALGAALAPGRRLVVVGGGFVGLEVAASARHLGSEVDVLEREDKLLSRVAGARLAEFLVAHHQRRGVRIHTGADVVRFEDRGDGSVGAVLLADGRSFPCDAVLVGVGAVPSDELARAAGLLCEGGIVVDSCAQTSHPRVYAVGDVTRRQLSLYEGSFRLESIPSATEQARQAVAAVMGLPAPPAEVPWFWSDQFDAKIKIAGLVAQADGCVRRGSTSDGGLALFYFSGRRVVAVESVNAAAEFMAGKKLIAQRAEIDPGRLSDPDVSLRELTGRG